jgi:hypothetical protein
VKVTRILIFNDDAVQIGWRGDDGIVTNNAIPLASYRRALLCARQAYAEGDSRHTWERVRACTKHEELRDFQAVILAGHALFQAHDEYYGFTPIVTV